MITIKCIASSSAGNCYRISDGDTSLLLEAGISFQRMQKALFYTVSHMDGCLITHEHLDHARAVNDLLKIGVPCYMSDGTAKELNVSEHHKVIKISAGEIVQINTFRVMAFEVVHDANEPLGYVLHSKSTGENLVFLTDTAYSRYTFKDINYIMVECNYAKDLIAHSVATGMLSAMLRDRIIKTHFSLDHCKEFLRANDISGVKEIHLLHLSDHNSDEERFQREIAAVSGRPVYVAKK